MNTTNTPITKLDLAKSVTNLVIGAGISLIVDGVVKNNVTPKNLLQRGLIFAGRTGISMVLSDVTKTHTDAKFDAAETWWKENITTESTEQDTTEE